MKNLFLIFQFLITSVAFAGGNSSGGLPQRNIFSTPNNAMVNEILGGINSVTRPIGLNPSIASSIILGRGGYPSAVGQGLPDWASKKTYPAVNWEQSTDETLGEYVRHIRLKDQMATYETGFLTDKGMIDTVRQTMPLQILNSLRPSFKESYMKSFLSMENRWVPVQ